MKPELHTDLQLQITDDSKRRLYLIHHMHHFFDGENITHELHHCSLFEKKNMRGIKYSIRHELSDNDLVHSISVNITTKLYDHDNNEFSVLDGIISL